MKDQICQHLQSLGVSPKNASRHANLIDKQIKSSGLEYVVKRYKSLSTALKSNLATGEYNIPDGWKTKRTAKGKTIIADGFIHKLLCAKSNSEIFQSNSIFKLHTLLSFPSDSRPSKAQMKKFNKAVLGDYIPEDADLYNDTMTEIADAIKEVMPGINKTPKISIKALRYLPKGTKTSPSYTRPDFKIHNGQEYKIETVSRTKIGYKSIEPFIASTEGDAFLRKHHKQSSQAILGDGPVRLSFAYKQERVPNIPIGIIGYIQEPSCKLRAVANVATVYQSLSEALKQKTKLIIENDKLPFCDTKDHNAGRLKAVAWLSEGRTVYGYDASSFTDTLPLTLQLKILTNLKEMGYIDEFDYDIFELCSKGSYYDPVFNRNITWKIGQPQGFGPSFNVATLTHVCIAMSCITSPSQKNLFSVIGDDILFADAALAKSYVMKMKLIGVDINLEKSLVSNSVSEFAGKIITEDGIVPSAKIKLLKHVDKMSKKDLRALSDTLVHRIKFYGPKAWLNMPKEYTEYAIKSILPEWAGGINFKYPGLSHEINFDALRLKSIKDDAEFYFAAVKTVDMATHLEWLTEFDAHLSDMYNYISPVMWSRFTGGSVGSTSSFNGMPKMAPIVGVVRNMLGRDSLTRIQITVANGRMAHQAHTIDSGRLKDLQSLLTATYLTEFMAYYLYQIQNQDCTKSVIIYDRKRVIYELKRELSPSQNDFLKYGIPLDYAKLYITADGYIKNEFLDALERQLGFKDVIPTPLDYNETMTNNTIRPQEGLNHAKYTNKR